MSEWEGLFKDDSSSDQSDQYHLIDEFEDVQSSLLLLRDALGAVKVTSSYWKWVILAVHSALQGACVCILTRTDGSGALREDLNNALLDKLYGETEAGRKIHDDTVPWPETRIAELPDLLKRLPAGLAVSLPGKKAQSYGYDLPGDLRRLHEFRNNFTHFPSVGWSIEIAGLPRIIEGAVVLTRDIIHSSAYSRYSQFQELDLQPLFDEILGRLAMLEV